MMKHAANSTAWAIGEQHVFLCLLEKREGEEFAASILIERKFKRRRAVA